MLRRMTPAQYNAWVRQENARRQRALDAYDAEVKRVNAHNQRVVADHNRKVDAHIRRVGNDYNQRVRAHNDRLRREVARLNSSSGTRHLTYRASVTILRQSFSRLETAADSATWAGSDDLLELSESETANSVATLNALLADDRANPVQDDEIAALRGTVISDELQILNPDLDARWRGALFALHPQNPDASRHFCTSAREMLSTLLESVAPDDEVVAADPSCDRTPQGSVSRRARIRHCLNRRGGFDEALESFIEADLDNVISLFDDFNSGTHGEAGRFDLGRLTAIKLRVEGAIQFVSRIAYVQ
jgi:Predicted pPIWI-associating nuclease